MGDVVPIIIWLTLERRFSNDLAWQEGGAFFIMMGLIALLIWSQITIFFLARKLAKSRLIALFALIVAGGSAGFGILWVAGVIGMTLYMMLPIGRHY